MTIGIKHFDNYCGYIEDRLKAKSLTYYLVTYTIIIEKNSRIQTAEIRTEINISFRN